MDGKGSAAPAGQGPSLALHEVQPPLVPPYSRRPDGEGQPHRPCLELGVHGHGHRRCEDGHLLQLVVGRGRRGGGRGLLMASTSGARLPLPLYVDLDASGEWRPLPVLPFAVSGTDVAGVHGVAPSVVEPGETFELSVRAEDAFRNRATGVVPAFEILVDGDVRAATPAGTCARRS